MALTYTPAIDASFKCPDFTLPGVDDRVYSLSDFQGTPALLVMFICNHCPYVKAIEDRLINLGNYFLENGLKLVAICSNDADNYPEDSFEKLRERWTEKKYPFPYLYDADQSVAHKFGAVCTPDFFLFDAHMQLAYRGRLDDSWKESDKVTQEELKQAVEALISNKPVSNNQIPSMGCNIKWKKP